MKGNATGFGVQVRARARGLVSLSGAQLLLETARTTGLDVALSVALERWRKPRSVHDPGKIVLDLAVMLAAGGDCPADTSMLRAGEALFGPVASAPTICRLVDALAGDLQAALTAIRSARAETRTWVHHLRAGDQDGEVVVDIDATLVTAHSEKQDAAPTYQRGFGFHPLMAYLDHGPEGTGEGLAALLRPGNANAGTAVDHLSVLDLIEQQLTCEELAGLVVRTDTAAFTHAFLAELADRGHGYSVGFYARADVAAAIEALPAEAWIPAVEAGGVVRDGAWVAELTHLLDLSCWPAGMRVIASTSCANTARRTARSACASALVSATRSTARPRPRGPAGRDARLARRIPGSRRHRRRSPPSPRGDHGRAGRPARACQRR